MRSRAFPERPFSRREVAENVWTVEGERIRFLTIPYALRMFVVRLSDGSLLLDSPVQLTPESRAAVDELGPVRHIVAPNRLHHLFAGHWSEAYPEAELHGAPGLARKRRDLRWSGELGDAPEQAWARDVDQCLFGGSWFLEEIVLFHRASRTMMVADLVENHDLATIPPLRGLFLRILGARAPDAVTAIIWQLTFWNRSVARRARDKMRSWKPERILVTHGPCIESDAAAFLEHALAWLGP